MNLFSADLMQVAQRVVWFKTPEEALQDSIFFLGHVMCYGTIQDILIVRKYYSQTDLIDAITHAYPGIYDARSWAYWHLVLGLPSQPLPSRFSSAA